MGRADGPPPPPRFPAPGRPGPAVRRGLAGALGGAGRLAGRRVQAPSARRVDRLEAGAAVPAALMSPPFSSPFSLSPSNPYRKGCCRCPVELVGERPASAGSAVGDAPASSTACPHVPRGAGRPGGPGRKSTGPSGPVFHCRHIGPLLRATGGSAPPGERSGRNVAVQGSA